MKTNTKKGLWIPLLISMAMIGCDKAEYQSLSFYSDYREVPVYGTALISPKTGSGNYTLEVENPHLLSAEVQDGWSSPTGMIAIQGKLTGNTTLTVTDNLTKESKKLKVKITDNYEAVRIFKYRDEGKDAPFPPSLDNVEYLSLVNNKARDLYLVGRKSISLTDYAFTVKGKGSYAFTKEGDDYILTLSYLVGDNEQPTLDKTTKTVSYRFLITTNNYALHRLNQNLNLGFDTSMTRTSPMDAAVPIKMEGVGTEYTLQGGLVPFFEMPVGFL